MKRFFVAMLNRGFHPVLIVIWALMVFQGVYWAFTDRVHDALVMLYALVTTFVAAKRSHDLGQP